MSDNISMGMSAQVNPEVTFARQFRWTLKGDSLPAEFMKTVSFDYANKTIKFSYYDVCTKDGGFDAIVWADAIANRNMYNETLTFTTYDGCGNPLYEFKFSDLSIASHEASFDYSISEPSCTTLTVKYGHIQKRLISCPDKFKRHEWRICCDGNEYPMMWNGIMKRPMLDIEETELNYLNAKTWIPGKVTWEDISFRSNRDLRNATVFACGYEGKKFEFAVRLYENDKMLEQWHMKGAWVKSCRFEAAGCDYTVSYDNVSYTSYLEKLPAKLPE